MKMKMEHVGTINVEFDVAHTLDDTPEHGMFKNIEIYNFIFLFLIN